MRRRQIAIHCGVTLLLIGLVVGSAATLRADETEDGFLSMFNGKDLTGWDGVPGAWEVRDGAIVSESTPERPSTRTHYLYWKGGEPADFEMRCRYRISGEGGNSGIQFRSRPRPNWDTWGYQADLDTEGVYTGCLYQHERGLVAERGQKVMIDQAGEKTVSRFADSADLLKAVKDDDWNEYRILAKGRRIALWINGVLMCEVEDHEAKYALPKGIISLQMHAGPPMRIEFKDLRIRILTGSTPISARAPPPKPKVEGWAFHRDRVEELLGRGVVAMPREDGGAYVQWRLLKTDPDVVAFNVYRTTDDGATVRLNDTPVSATTDFLDTSARAGAEYAYFVRTIVGGREGGPSEQFSLPSRAGRTPYLSVKLQDPQTTFQKVGIADLNGDGRYDFVIKTPNTNIDPWYRYWRPSETTYRLEAYLSDGTFLWSKELGWNIEAGIWYSPYVVYDFDGDGRAEVAVKTAPMDVDYRDTEPGGDPGREYLAGRVRMGPEYLSILDGMTGEEKARADWPSREGFGEDDRAYNLASRNQMGIAYLDGKTPCVLVARGTYGTMKLTAYEYHNSQLKELWSWDSREEPCGLYRGQGAHFMHSADIDGDGRDEVILGSCVIDDNGQGLWSTGLGHPDHCYVGDIDPTRSGLEIYYGIERRQPRYGVCLVDARTGEILWGLEKLTHHIHGAGLVSDIDPAHVGQECYSGEHPEVPTKDARWLHSAQGELIADETTWDMGLSPRAVYWDATPQRAVLMRHRLFKYPDQTLADDIEGHQAAWADVLGDWREEIITSVPGELRIYLTPLPASDRRITLMQDPLYRSDVAHLSMGYPQPPMTSYYLGPLEIAQEEELRRRTP